MNRRQARAAGALCVLLLRPLAACHSYAPPGGIAPASGTRVKVEFGEPRTVTVRFDDGDSTVYSGVRDMVGMVQRVDRDSIQLSDLSSIFGLREAGRQLTEADHKAGIVNLVVVGSEVRAEQFSPARTALAVALGVGALVVALGLLALNHDPLPSG